MICHGPSISIDAENTRDIRSANWKRDLIYALCRAVDRVTTTIFCTRNKGCDGPVSYYVRLGDFLLLVSALSFGMRAYNTSSFTEMRGMAGKRPTPSFGAVVEQRLFNRQIIRQDNPFP